MAGRDASFDYLLSLDGTEMQLTDDGAYIVRFRAVRVESSEARPHGLSYALNLHGPASGDPGDDRLVGFDNAHAPHVAGPARIRRWDHRHRLTADPRPYDYSDAGRLLEDFWDAVGQMMRERGFEGW